MNEHPHWLEHLDVAGAILAAPYRAVQGKIAAKGPGFGLDWDERAITRYSADN